MKNADLVIQQIDETAPGKIILSPTMQKFDLLVRELYQEVTPANWNITINGTTWTFIGV